MLNKLRSSPISIIMSALAPDGGRALWTVSRQEAEQKITIFSP